LPSQKIITLCKTILLKKKVFLELAEELGISPETVKQQQKLAKVLLQLELREELANFLF
jgi:DNA-binding CsgD family transcriptional regulator